MTPWIDYTESIYRYRFQGTVFAEREGFLTSSDLGASFHYNFAKNYGDVHVVHNGTPLKPEANNQQAFQIRAYRPFANQFPCWRLRATGSMTATTTQEATRRRARSSRRATRLHPPLTNTARDGSDHRRARCEGRWLFVLRDSAPRSAPKLIRYDHFTPNDA
jgi:hypothetical protein